LSDRLKIIKDIIGYSASSLISQALSVVAGLWVARMLGPSNFGIWNAVSLVLIYGAYSEFGILSAMGRELPFYRGKGDLEKAASVEGVARHATFVGSLLAALIVLVCSFLPGQAPMMARGLQAMAVVLILQQVYTYHRILLRSYNQFRELSQQQVLLAIFNSGLAVAFVLFLGLTGRMIAAIMAQAAIVLYAVRRNPWRPVPKFHAPVAWALMRVGVPITISGFILSLVTTVDRLMVITFLDEKQLGYIGIALLIAGVVSLIPAMAIQVLVPRINYQFGNSGKDVAALRSFVLTPPTILSALLPILIGSIYLSLPFVIGVLLPAYTPAITAIRIIILGIFFYCILGMTDVFLVTTGKLKQYALFGCIALLLNIILDYLSLQLGYGIEGIAFGGTLITYFFYSCIVIGYALSHYTKRLGDWVRFFLRLWLPFIYMIVLLWFVEMAVNRMMPWASNMELLFSTLAKLLFYIICCLPLMYVGFRELKLDFSKPSLIR
jgi:O-antigen/teichoic acid export membrane protein